MADEEGLGGQGVRLDVHVCPSHFGDEGGLSNVGVAADKEFASVGVGVGKTGDVLSYLLEVGGGIFLSFYNGRHAR